VQGRRSVLQIMIDREQGTRGLDGSGVTLEDCTNVSRDLSTVLDMHEDLVPGHYNLEVSSPGLDRPLTKLSHFERFVGREAKVEIKAPIEGRRRFDGPILGVEGDIVTIEQDKKPVAIPFGDVVKAHLVYRF
jgi:ribosome maturation factor RimP